MMGGEEKKREQFALVELGNGRACTLQGRLSTTNGYKEFDYKIDYVFAHNDKT